MPPRIPRTPAGRARWHAQQAFRRRNRNAPPPPPKLTKLARTLKLRSLAARAILKAGGELPERLRNSIIHPRKDYRGTKHETEMWLNFLDQYYPDLADLYHEREWRRDGRISDRSESEEVEEEQGEEVNGGEVVEEGEVVQGEEEEARGGDDIEEDTNMAE